MSGLDKNRKRNQTISFRMTEDERRRMEGRIKACGLPKGEYFVRFLLNGRIYISVGKYESDRLSLELKRLGEQMAKCNSGKTRDLLEECIALFRAVVDITQGKDDEGK